MSINIEKGTRVIVQGKDKKCIAMGKLVATYVQDGSREIGVKCKWDTDGKPEIAYVPSKDIGLITVLKR